MLEYFTKMTASRIIWLIGVAIVVGQEDSVLNEVEMKNRLQLYNSEALVKWSALRHAEWNCSTDIGNDSKEVERVSALFVFLWIAEVKVVFFFNKKKVTVMVSVDIVFVHMDIECEYVRFRTYLSCFFLFSVSMHSIVLSFVR